MKQIDLIYLIDDDSIVLFLGTKLFARHESFKCLQTFENGQSALDTLAAQAEDPSGWPDAILLDLNMPGMDGWKFLEELSRIPGAAHIPVIIQTSSVDPRDIGKSKTFVNVKDYIPKPLTVAKLDRIFAHITA